MKSLWISLFLFSSNFYLSIHAAPLSDKCLENHIDPILQNESVKFNGEILISCGYEVIYHKTLGFNGTAPLMENSQFLIGSISKQITAVLILRAVEKQLLALDNPIGHYLQSLHDNWAQAVTIHQILNHTSGITARGLPLDFPPGTKFSYSNEGYDLLGELLETVTGKKFSLLVSELFQEITDSNATLAPDSSTLEGLSKKYVHLAIGQIENEGGHSNIPSDRRKKEHNPSSGIISTVHDLLHWNISLHAGQLLQQESYRLMIKSSATRPHRWGLVSYGYGLQISTDELNEISHNGIIPGYTSSLIYYPNQKISVVILENRALWTKEWEIADKKRTYYTHDLIRQSVRDALMRKTIPPQSIR
jgi:CubicO group peptidase (beta-lactamase class C family)